MCLLMVSPQRVVVAAASTAAALALACASAGVGGEEPIPNGILIFDRQNPPRCPHEEVGRLTFDFPGPSAAGCSRDMDCLAKREQDRDDRRHEVQEAYDGLDADAVIVTGRSLAKEYTYIRFTDSDCRE